MDLSKVGRESLVALLSYGDNTPKNISERTDRHRKSVSRSLRGLSDEGYVTEKGGGVYALTPDGVSLARALRREGCSV